MATMARVRVTWAGGPIVGPGVSTFYIADSAWSSANQTALKNFFTGIAGVIPSGVTWTIPGYADVISDDSGALVSSISVGSDQTVTSTGGTSFVEGVGGRIVWKTSSIVPNRKNPGKTHRVRGATFILPMTSNSFGTDGRLAAGGISTLQGNATTLASAWSTNMLVWSRPPKGATTGGHSSPVTGVQVNPTPSWLRSRKL